MPPAPLALAIVAVVATVISLRRVVRILRDLRAVRLGIWGERYVGQALEDLYRPRGYRVLHDLPSRTEDFNVDHVLIGPEGVFAVETKHCSRPTAGDRIIYDGQSVKIPGVNPRRTSWARRGRRLDTSATSCAGPPDGTCRCGRC